MNPYEALSVEKDAPPEQIKAAYRREAAKAHPDREGGSTERMALVNEAYDILSDPERRKRYDETGSTQEAPSVETEARDMLAQIFTNALEQDHAGVIEFARNQAAQFKAQLTQQRETALAKIRKLEAKRPKVRTKGGAINLVQGLIDQQLAGLRENVGRMGRGLEVAGVLASLLDAYEEDAPPPQRYLVDPVWSIGGAAAQAAGTFFGR